MSVLTAIVDFLLIGYPEGVPKQDYVPLLALLKRQLTDEEVRTVAHEVLDSRDPDSASDITRAITAITNEQPLPSDIARVAARLAAAGWPLAPLNEVQSRV
jgi:hypothetical protein